MTEAQLRDELAIERTHLANERTLLAYIRTALALAGGGAVLLQFFPSYPILLVFAILLVVVGGATAILGILRFVAVSVRLKGKSPR
jgi:putative membrane protein